MRLARLLFTITLAGSTSVQAATVTSAQSSTGTLTAGATVRSYMQLDGPGVETWRFEGVAGQVVSVTARSRNFEPTMHLVSPTGEELVRDDEGILDDRGRDDAQLVALLPTDGEYLVRVAAEGPAWGGAYEVALHVPTVTPLELNTPVGGRYDEARGHDVWSFEGRAGQVVSVTVRPDGFTPLLQLTSPGGDQLAWSDNYVVPGQSAQLLASLPVDGRYLVDVHDAFLFESGRYEIAVHAVTPAPLEKNVTVGGALAVEGPAADVWSFYAVAGEAVDVLVTADAFHAEYYVIAPAGDILVDFGRTVPLAVGGRYLLGVVNGGDLGLRGAGGRYEVSVRPVPVSPLAVDEPVVSLLADRSTDAEVWGFDGVVGQVVSVKADSEEHENLQIELISPAGEELASDYRHRMWGAARFVASLPVDGRYLVRVEAVGTPEPRPYALEVRVLRETPTLLEMDAPATARFDGAGPKVGFWEFEGNAGQLVDVATRSAAFSTSIELVSPSGAVVATSFRWPRARVTELLAVSGRYGIRVMAREADVGRYEVRFGSTGVSPHPLEMDGPAVVDERDVKLWSFDGAAGEVVRITARGAYMNFDVISPAGDIVAMNDGQLVVRLPLDGRYLVRLTGFRRGDPGRYAVAASAVTGAAQAPSTLTMNMPARGVLDQDESGIGDWVFEGSAGEVVAIAVNGFYDPVVQLLSPTGEELAWAYSADESAQLEARLPVTGRYRVRVLAHTGWWTSPNSMDYEIEVRRAPTPATR